MASDEIRKKVCKKSDYGHSYRMIAKALDLSYQTVQTIMKRYRKYGQDVKLTNRFHQPPKLSDELKCYIKKILDKDCSKTYRYIQTRIKRKKLLRFPIGLSEELLTHSTML